MRIAVAASTIVFMLISIGFASTSDAQSRLPRAVYHARPLQSLPLSKHATLADSKAILQKTRSHSWQKAPAVQKGCKSCGVSHDACVCGKTACVSPWERIDAFLDQIFVCHKIGCTSCKTKDTGCGREVKPACGCEATSNGGAIDYLPDDMPDDITNPFEDDPQIPLPPAPPIRSTYDGRRSAGAEVDEPPLQPIPDSDQTANRAPIGTGLRLKTVNLIDYQSPVR